MLFLDVNVLVAAHRPESGLQWHRVEQWLDQAVVEHRPIGVAEFVVASFIRIVTNRRAFEQPSTPAQAVEFGDRLLHAPAAVVVHPGNRHWEIFTDLVTRHRLRANQVPDAYLASLAMEQGAAMVSMDRGFARFGDLTVVDPITP